LAILWGHQITMQHRPDEVLPAASRGQRHFGVGLPWNECEPEAPRIAKRGVRFLDAEAEGTR